LQFLQVTSTTERSGVPFSLLGEDKFSSTSSVWDLLGPSEQDPLGVSFIKEQPSAGSGEVGTMQKRILPIIALSMALITPAVIQGCSSQSETTTTTTSEEPQSAPTMVTTSTTTTSNEPDSVLGATFHAIGTIILFPFRLVGDAIGLIV
jgi:hypothetical protein